jgi:EthD domain-containing protein
MSEPAVKKRKVMQFLACPPGADRAAFREHYLRRHAPMVLRNCPRLMRYVVNLVDIKASIRHRMEMAPRLNREVDPPPFEVVTEMWFGSFDDYKDPQRLYASPAAAREIDDDLRAMGATVYDYLIAQTVQWDRTPRPAAGERTPGVKAIILTRRKAELPNKEVEALWRKHRIVAEKYHCYATSYIQDGVIAPLTTNAPVAHGLAELYFPTKEDLEERFYGGTIEGETAVAADAGPFVADAIGLYSSEYVMQE